MAKALFVTVVFAACSGESVTTPATGGDDPREPKAEVPAAEPTADTVRLAIDPNVPAASRVAIASFVTPGDSIGSGAEEIQTSLTTRPIVLALDEQGDALLASDQVGSGGMVLSSRSTALVLVRSMMFGFATSIVEDDAIDVAAQAHPSFDELVAAVEQELASGRAYVRAAHVANLAVEIAADVVGTDDPAGVSTRSAVATSHRFEAGPAYLEGTGGGSVRVANASFVPLAMSISSGAPADTVILGKEKICLLCWPPSFGITPFRAEFREVSEGAFTVTAAMGEAQRNAIWLELAMTVIAAPLQAAGYATRGLPYSELIPIIGRKLTVTRAFATGGQEAALRSVIDEVISFVPQLAAWIAAKLATPEKGIAAVLSNLIAPLKFVDMAAYVGQSGFLMKDAWQYWGGSWTINTCMIDGRVFRACVASVEVLPSAPVTLRPGESVALSAVVRDADGQDMSSAVPVDWVSSEPAVAAVDAMSGSVTAGYRGGSTVITATSGGERDTAQVNVDVSPPLIAGTYTLKSVNGRPQCAVRSIDCWDPNNSRSWWGELTIAENGSWMFETWVRIVDVGGDYKSPWMASNLWNATPTFLGIVEDPIRIPDEPWCIETTFVAGVRRCFWLPPGFHYSLTIDGWPVEQLGVFSADGKQVHTDQINWEWLWEKRDAPVQN